MKHKFPKSKGPAKIQHSASSAKTTVQSAVRREDNIYRGKFHYSKSQPSRASAAKSNNQPAKVKVPPSAFWGKSQPSLTSAAKKQVGLHPRSQTTKKSQPNQTSAAKVELQPPTRQQQPTSHTRNHQVPTSTILSYDDDVNDSQAHLP